MKYNKVVPRISQYKKLGHKYYGTEDRNKLTLFRLPGVQNNFLVCRFLYLAAVYLSILLKLPLKVKFHYN